MKNFLAFVLALLMALSLAACGAGEKETDGDAATPPATDGSEVLTNDVEQEKAEDDSVLPPADDGSEDPNDSNSKENTEGTVSFDVAYSECDGILDWQGLRIHVIKNQSELASYLSEMELEDSVYIEYDSLYDSAFFEDRMLISVFGTCPHTVYPVVNEVRYEDQKTVIFVMFIVPENNSVIAMDGKIMLLSLDVDENINSEEDIEVVFDSKEVNYEEYNLVRELYGVIVT